MTLKEVCKSYTNKDQAIIIYVYENDSLIKVILTTPRRVPRFKISGRVRTATIKEIIIDKETK